MRKLETASLREYHAIILKNNASLIEYAVYFMICVSKRIAWKTRTASLREYPANI